MAIIEKIANKTTCMFVPMFVQCGMEKDARVFIRVSSEDKERIRAASSGDMSKLMRDAVMSRVARIERQEARNLEERANDK